MKNAFRLFSVIALMAIIGVSFAALSLTGCDIEGDNDGSIPPEDLPVKDRWGKWVADDATATLDYSVGDDGVCTITVGGIAQTNNEADGWYRWKANASYAYTAKAGKSYIYTFEAWTELGTRELFFQYNTDNDNEIYKGQDISLTTERKTYTVYGQPLSNGVFKDVGFLCADQLGTFYVKMLEIKEYINMDVPAIAEMDRWLKAQPANTPATAYTYKLNISNLGGNAGEFGSAGAVLIANNTKYVNLDLSGSTITSIKNWAFFGCTSLTSVTIPNSVTSIETSAFEDCTGLASVIIPNSVTSIGNYAFIRCTSLASVTIGNGVTSIGDSAFDGCASLTTSITIPSSVTSMGRDVFANCTSLTSVTFQGTIAANSFGRIGDDGGFRPPFMGDLNEKYLDASGGIGTYTTTAPVGWNSVWMKQNNNEGEGIEITIAGLPTAADGYFAMISLWQNENAVAPVARSSALRVIAAGTVPGVMVQSGEYFTAEGNYYIRLEVYSGNSETVGRLYDGRTASNQAIIKGRNNITATIFSPPISTNTFPTAPTNPFGTYTGQGYTAGVIETIQLAERSFRISDDSSPGNTDFLSFRIDKWEEIPSTDLPSDAASGGYTNGYRFTGKIIEASPNGYIPSTQTAPGFTMADVKADGSGPDCWMSIYFKDTRDSFIRSRFSKAGTVNDGIVGSNGTPRVYTKSN